jgi:putative transposase
MGSAGDAYDNAMAESFFATLECELLHRHRFATRTQARVAVLDDSKASPTWPSPLRSGQRSPADDERSHQLNHPATQP